MTRTETCALRTPARMNNEKANKELPVTMVVHTLARLTGDGQGHYMADCMHKQG